MAKSDVLNIRIEPDLKEQTEEILNYLGMTMSEAVTLFFKQVVINDGIPFEIRKPRYKRRLKKAMKEAENLKKHLDKTKVYNNVEELMEDLRK